MTRRLLLSYLTITVLVLVLLEVPLAVFYAQRERERIAADVEHDAYVLATFYEDALENGRPLDPSVRRSTYRTRTGARVVVVDRNGISKVDTDQARRTATSPLARRSPGARRQHGHGDAPLETLGTDLLYVAVPVASGGSVHGALRVTLDTSDVNARIRRFWLALVAIAAVILIAVALVGWALARSVTRPLRQLRRDGDRDSPRRPHRGSRDEHRPARGASTRRHDVGDGRRLDELLPEPTDLRRRRLPPTSHAAHRAASPAREPAESAPRRTHQPSSTPRSTRRHASAPSSTTSCIWPAPTNSSHRGIADLARLTA